MSDSLWFTTILKEQPWWGVVIGLGFFALLFLVKVLVMRLYSKSQAAVETAPQVQESD